MLNYYEQLCQAFIACYATADFSRATPGKFKLWAKQSFSVVPSSECTPKTQIFVPTY